MRVTADEPKPANAAQATDASSGPTREGLFLDVPYILDSLFRWSEYRANRAGHVDLSDTAIRPTWVLDHGWRSPAFLLYSLVSVFLVFGPTFDSLCGLLGPEGLKTAARWLSWIVLALILAFYVWQLLRVVQRFARRLRSNADNYNLGSTPVLGSLSNAIRGATRSVLSTLPSGILSESRFDTVLDLIPDLGQQTQRLNGRGVWRCIVGVVVCLLVVAGVSAPLWLVWASLAHAAPAAAVCQIGNQSAVVAQLVTLGVWLALGAWIWSTDHLKSELQRLVALSVLWLLGLTVLWGGFARDHVREMTPGPYPQLYTVLLVTLIAFAFFAYWFAQRLFGFPKRVWYREYRDAQKQRVRVSWRRLMREQLQKTELIDNERADPQLSSTRIIGAFVNGIGQQPLQFLLLPAFVALVWTPQNLFTATVIALVLGAVLLAYGSLAERWQQIVTYIERWYFVGVPLPLSILVIVLGVLRLLDVQYVSTVLDAAPLGTLVLIIVMSYAAAWFYEYWINRWPAERLLDALAGIDDRRQGWIPVNYTTPCPAHGTKASPRTLAVHGTGRYCAHGWFERTQPALWEKTRDAAFTTYDLIGLFEMLAPPGDGMAGRAVSSLRRRLRLYFYTLNALLVVALWLLWQWHVDLATPARSAAVVTASLNAAPAPKALPLSARLLAKADASRPAIIVAASGGGTRAALYTAHALQGLARLGRAGDVVLISGVSGGGFASAVFAADASRLQSTSSLEVPFGKTKTPWQELRTAVTEPFIADVIDGVGELRILNTTPLGQLLAESFTARTFAGAQVSFQSLNGPALILNTSISGHPSDESQLLDRRAALGASPKDCTTMSSLAGSRLIFTNLPQENMVTASGESTWLDPFPGDASSLPDVRLDYTVVRDPTVSVAAAAALNANFPPVFPNARVVVSGGASRCAERSFYVTDGGATENLGLVSALYAMQGALRVWPSGKALPPIHVVAIEASAVSYDYTQDRGLGAATGGSKERINGELTEMLLGQIRQRVTELHGELHLHYLPLPVAFRSRGGFGTHWMYAKEFRVTNPFVADVPNRFKAPIRERLDGFSYYENIRRTDLAALWNGLFRADAAFCDDRLFAGDLKLLTHRAQQVRAWICGHVTTDDTAADGLIGKDIKPDSDLARLLRAAKKPDFQVEAWERLVRELGAVEAATASTVAR